MTLATATGRCWTELANSIEGFEPVPDNAVVMFGTRDLDPGEGPALDRTKIVRLKAGASLGEIEPALQTIGQTLDKFYIHLDMDALDPAEGRANGFAARNGFSNEKLQELLATIASQLPIEALTIASYDPAFDTEGRVCAIALEAAGTVLTGLGAPRVVR